MKYFLSLYLSPPSALGVEIFYLYLRVAREPAICSRYIDQTGLVTSYIIKREASLVTINQVESLYTPSTFDVRLMDLEYSSYLLLYWNKLTQSVFFSSPVAVIDLCLV